MRMDIYCLGDAVVDAIADVPEGFLVAHLLPEGATRQITPDAAAQLLTEKTYEYVAGGNGANIANTTALLGGHARFVGKTGADEQGAFFTSSFHNNVAFQTAPSPDYHTGTVFTFITPDKERTFAAYCGASAALSEEDILEDEIKAAGIVYLDGFTLRSESGYHAMVRALKLAQKHGKKTAFSPNDLSVIEGFGPRCDIFFQACDYLFFNIGEALRATGRAEFSGLLQYFENRPQTVVITNGEQGSYILPQGRPMLQVGAEELNTPLIDTNGAGDAYAAGYLYAVSRNASPDQCAKLAALTARECLQSQGARITKDLGFLSDEVF
ncbi:MAG: adenosine kinase [Pseudobdellovibrionaceae bacterium]